MNSISLPPTNPTVPCPVFGIAVGVGFIVRMSLRAMSLVQLTCCGDRATSAAPPIFGKGDGFKVNRIHAIAHAAEMVNGQASRDGAVVKFVRESVCQYLPERAVFTSSPSEEITVAQTANIATPEPASISLFNLKPEPFGWSEEAAVVGRGRVRHIRKSDYNTADM